MKKIFKYFKTLDWFFIGFVLLVIVVFLVFNFEKNTKKATHLKVTSLGKTYLYSLSEDKVFEIQGRIGKTKIEIKGGFAKVVFSPCPTKTCMAKPPICNTGEWIVCLPNEVFLKIEGRAKSTDDVVIGSWMSICH